MPPPSRFASSWRARARPGGELQSLVLQGGPSVATPTASFYSRGLEPLVDLPVEPVPDLAVVVHLAVQAVDRGQATKFGDERPIALAGARGVRVVHVAQEGR